MQADFSWIYFDAFFALLCDTGIAGFAGAAHCKYRAENATKLKKNTIHLNELQVPERLPSGDIEAIFSLCDSDYTFSMWQVLTVFFGLGVPSYIFLSRPKNLISKIISSINSASPTVSY